MSAIDLARYVGVGILSAAILFLMVVMMYLFDQIVAFLWQLSAGGFGRSHLPSLPGELHEPAHPVPLTRSFLNAIRNAGARESFYGRLERQVAKNSAQR